jgi:tetratricopeptide (TPR) repeat protein
MLPTDVFFADIEKVMLDFTEADRPRLRKMIEELDHIAERVPRVADRCYTYQAKLYAKLEEYEQALTSLERALELTPMDDHLLILRGDIYQQAEDYSKALQDYTKVLEEHPEAVTARIRRAEMLHATGDYEKALDDINNALKHEPRSLRLIYRRGLILADLRRPKDASADFKMVAQLSPDGELKKKAEQRLRELGERS